MKIRKYNLFRFLLCAGLLTGASSCQDQNRQEEIPGEQSPVSPGYNADGTRRGALFVKFASSPELNKALMTRAGSATVGVKSVDDVTASLGNVKMERVFRYAGKFEERQKKYGLDRWYRLEFDEDADLTKATRSYAVSPAIECVEPVYKMDFCALPVMPFNDPLLTLQWHYDLGTKVTHPDANIGLFKAWQVTTGSPGVIVAIVDQGVDWKHPDLAANMWVNVDEKNGRPYKDDDGNGYDDDIYGYDFNRGTGNVTGCAHGTHVAGTVAAVNNNGIGLGGVAGGSGQGDGVCLMSCQIASENSYMGGEAEAIVYAAHNKAVICQCSWGADNNFQTLLKDAIDYFVDNAGCDENGVQTGPMKGGVLLFAAGNDNHKEPNFYPAKYPKVIAVGATTTQNKRAWYSNYATWVDISAPGGDGDKSDLTRDIYSTLPNNGYGYMAGTSMACPHVAGIAALIISAKGGPGFTSEMLTERLLQSVIPLPDEPDRDLMGRGLLRADLALWENDNTAPDPVRGMAVKETEEGILLSWTITGEPNDGKARSYRVYASVTPLVEGSEAPGTVASYVTLQTTGNVGEVMSYILPAVPDVKTLYYAVAGLDLWGNVAKLSNVIRFEWKNDGVAPEAVNDLRLVNTGNGYVLEWSVTADRSDGTPLLYKLYAGTAAPDATIWEDARSFSLPVEGRQVGAKMTYPVTFQDMDKTQYYFVVSGKDRWGNLAGLSNVAKNVLMAAGALKVYPNPVETVINLNWGSGFDGEKTVSLYDLSGRLVFRQSAGNTPGSGMASFDLSAVASGKYVLKFESGAGTKSVNILKR